MYWFPEMLQTPIGVRFLVASNYCRAKPLSNTICQIFKIIFNTVESFYNKNLCYLGCKKVWVVQNSLPVATELNKINVKKKAKSVSTFDFSILYTAIPHELLLKVRSEVIKFVLKFKVTKGIAFSIISIYRTSKGAGRRYFAEQILFNAMSFLINKCFYTLLVTWFLSKILVYQWINGH